MGYIGNQASTNFSSFAKQVITGNGGATYTLTTPVANSNELEIFVNNVRQEPGVAYNVSGTALTMTGNVASTDNFYVVYQGKAVQTTVPPDGSVSTAKIADGVVTNAKIDTVAASKLTGALPAIDGSALTGVGSNIKEQLTMLCDGGDYTVSSGTYTSTNVDAVQNLTSSYVDVNGSVISYTPPAGTTAVVYEYTCQISRASDGHSIGHYKFFIDGVEIIYNRHSISANSNPELVTTFKYIIPIGGTTNNNTGRQASWSGAKTLKIQAREYGSGNEQQLFRTYYFDGVQTQVFSTPILTITALG